MTAYYNEIDPYAAQWLRNLMAAGLIADGEVDERSILDVRPSELKGFTQCHFFAGVGVWSYALRQAGWPDDRPVWTGSCPCQPFSGAGKRAGFADERHLWPAFHWLIAQCRPGVIFGEQVASKGGLGWLDHVQADLEAQDYACGTLDLCAAGFGAPHLRQRLWFVAARLGNPSATRLPLCERESVEGQGRRKERRATEQSGRTLSWVADATDLGLYEAGQRVTAPGCHGSAGNGAAGRVADTDSAEPEQPEGEGPGSLEVSGCGADGQPDGRCSLPAAGPAGPTNGYWRAADWLWCRDGKWRPVEPGTFPLADGTPGRVGRLRAYGNAIPAPVAAEFIASAMELLP